MAKKSAWKGEGSAVIIKRFVVGGLETNCYLVGCTKTKEALIIDPGFDRKTEADAILKEIRRRGLHVLFIVNTHGHLDHISGNGILKEVTGASILIHEYDASMLTNPAKNLSQMFGFNVTSPPADRTLRDGDVIRAGDVELRVLHTPGHSRGSICLLGDGVVFTGDTLFAGSIGRTDFPGSSYKEIMHSLKSRLMTLPNNVKVYPGTGPTSTIGEEKRRNPFLQGLL